MAPQLVFPRPSSLLWQETFLYKLMMVREAGWSTPWKIGGLQRAGVVGVGRVPPVHLSQLQPHPLLSCVGNTKRYVICDRAVRLVRALASPR